jgi:hypothetical protein
MLCKSGRSSYTEHNKIRFAIFGFSYELIWNLQVSGSNNKTGKNLIALSPLGLLNLHNMPSQLTRRPPGQTPLHNSTSRGGEGSPAAR